MYVPNCEQDTRSLYKFTILLDVGIRFNFEFVVGVDLFLSRRVRNISSVHLVPEHSWRILQDITADLEYDGVLKSVA